MWDGLADVINGSIQANEQFTQLPAEDHKAMKFVWITARAETLEQAPEAGMGNTTRDDMLQYSSPEVRIALNDSEDFTFDKEFFFLYNNEMDDAIVKQIDAALTEIFQEGAIQERQKAAFFIPNFLPSDAARAHLMEKSDTYQDVISQIGDLWPNTGLGFLICSIIYVFLIGVLFLHERNRRSVMPVAMTAIIAPALVWWLFTDLFYLTLP